MLSKESAVSLSPEDASYAAIVALTARRRHSYLCPKIAVVGYRYDGFLYHLQRREKTQNAAVNHKFGSPLAKQKPRFIPPPLQKRRKKRKEKLKKIKLK